jgi:hypothetical protein
MSTCAATPTESLPSSDVSSTTIQFDWYDDHSSWRLEELQPSIEKAIAILAANKITFEQPEHLRDLPRIARELRVLHRDRDVEDKVVRTGLELADELDFGDETENCDAQFQYECVVDEVDEALTQWDEAHAWRFTDEGWQIDSLDQFNNEKQSRYGLGDRWSVTIDDDSVELPNGNIVRGYNPSKSKTVLMTEIYNSIYDEDDLGQVAALLVALDEAVVPRATELLDAVTNEFDSLEVATVRAVLQVAADMTLNDLILDQIVETVTALAGEWHQSAGELIFAASSLTPQSV